MLFTTRVTEEDLAIMTKLARGHFYKVVTILKQLPRSMLLVFRWGRSSQSGVFLRHNPLSPKNDQNQFSPFNINKQPRKRLWELLKWPQERDCFHWSLNRLSIRPSLGVRGEEFYTGGSAPRFNPLPFYLLFFFTEKIRLSYTFYWQIKPLSSSDHCIPFNRCKCTVFFKWINY